MMRNNLKVAITGGIGSGKSTVAKIIAGMGYSVISCDEIYKNLLNDKNFANSIAEEFGNVLNADGSLDRKMLSEKVFSDESKLQRLNEITHPKILEEALKKMAGEGIHFCEVPLLFEGGYEKLFDAVIVVLRNEEQRISAVVKRDKMQENLVKKRLKSQFDYKNASFEKYYVIHNNCNLKDLQAKVQELVKKIKI